MRRVVASVLISVTVFLLVLFMTRQKRCEPFTQKRDVPGKTIWILWWQGWDHAPWLAREVASSWERLNPEWNVVRLSESNLRDYVNIDYLHKIETVQAKSDVIRITLLTEHGGVWADASLPCLIPLDRWIYDALDPVGFWTYHGWEGGKGPAVWFIVSMRNTYIIQAWKKAVDRYWINRTRPDNYIWLDTIFMDLIETDSEFKKQWSQVPYIDCDAPGQAHMLAGKCDENDEGLQQILRTNPPYVVKCSMQHIDSRGPTPSQKDKASNAYAAIETAKFQRYAPYPLHEMTFSRSPSLVFRKSVLVTADCKHTEGILEFKKLCDQYGVQMIAYDKCNFCKHIPPGIYCRPLRNVGRDIGTPLYFVLKYYDRLPEHMYFVPANTSKHQRLERFKALLEHPDDIPGCSDFPMEGNKDFVLPEYEGKTMKLARARPFKKWYETYIGPFDPNVRGTCWNGVMHSTRERVYRTRKRVLEEIYDQLIEGNDLEVGHYGERVMAAIL